MIKSENVGGLDKHALHIENGFENRREIKQRNEGSLIVSTKRLAVAEQTFEIELCLASRGQGDEAMRTTGFCVFLGFRFALNLLSFIITGHTR